MKFSSGILSESRFGKNLLNGLLNLPAQKQLPDSSEVVPIFFVADAAFPLKQNIMRPYPGKNLTEAKSIFNYRLSRARRTIENSFGILVARWRILRNTINAIPENAEKIVLACIVLHNFIMLNDKNKNYCPQHFTDWEDEEHVVHNGPWRNNVQPLPSTNSFRSNNSQKSAIQIRNTLTEYFMNEGAVPFQWNK